MVTQKYSPAAWSATVGPAGTVTISDVDNTNFTYEDVQYGANRKAVKFLGSAESAGIFALLDISQTSQISGLLKPMHRACRIVICH